jgi:hypothetical protein
MRFLVKTAMNEIRVVLKTITQRLRFCESDCCAPNADPIKFRHPFRQNRPALLARWVPGRSADWGCSARLEDLGCSARLEDSDCLDHSADYLAALYDRWDYLASSERWACRDYFFREGSARWGCSGDYWGCWDRWESHYQVAESLVYPQHSKQMPHPLPAPRMLPSKSMLLTTELFENSLFSPSA